MKNLLATLTLGLSGAVLFSACAPGQYVQDTETDDLYFTSNDRNTVEVTQLNTVKKAAYDKDGSYVYQEEVASKNFNPDAVDVNRYTSENDAEQAQADYYVSEEERALNNNQFNGAQANYAAFGNPAFNRARMWNDPFFNPMWGGMGMGRMGMGMGGFGNPYWNSMAFYDPFYDPFMMGGPMGFDPFFGPGWGMRPGFNVSVGFGFGFGNAFAFGNPWGFNRWNRWNRFGGFGGFGGYNAGFYDGFYANPYNRFGFCPPAIAAVRNDFVAANQRRVTRGGTSARTSRAVRQNTGRQYDNRTRSRNSYTANRSNSDAYNARSRNSLYEDQGRARSRVSTSANRSNVAPSTTRSSRSYDPNRVQQQRNSNYGTRQRGTTTAPSRGNSNYNRSGSRSRSYGNSGSRSSSYGNSRSRSSNYGSSSRSSGYSSGSSSRSSSGSYRSSGSSSSRSSSGSRSRSRP
ncbi:MAG: hypothetical protein WBA23_18680 [Tunicatimonas sp.]|uniref:hypothetical protein n=1 Tax=Tunicatimonas sp. TaxID=1940096 RepID=UPI003C7954CE